MQRFFLVFRFLWLGFFGLLIPLGCGDNPNKETMAPDASDELNQKIRLGTTYVSKGSYPASISFEKNLKIILGTKSVLDLALGIDAQWIGAGGNGTGRKIDVKELFLFFPDSSNNTSYKAKVTIARPMEWDDELLADYFEGFSRGYRARISAACLGFREGRILEFSKPAGLAPERLQRKYRDTSDSYTYYVAVDTLSPYRDHRFIGLTTQDRLFDRLVPTGTEKRAQAKILAERFSSASEKLCEGTLRDRTGQWDENILYIKEFSADHLAIVPKSHYYSDHGLVKVIKDLQDGYFTQVIDAEVDLTARISSALSLKGRSGSGEGLFDLEIGPQEPQFSLVSGKEDTICRFSLQGVISRITRSSDMFEQGLSIYLDKVVASVELLKPNYSCRVYEDLKNRVKNNSVVFSLSNVYDSHLTLAIPEGWQRDFSWEAR